MPRYFHVEGGQIKKGPRTLPNGWRNISGLHHLPPAKLKALGWLPEKVVGFEPFDPITQVRDGPVHDIQADKVVSTYSVRAKTAQELDNEKNVLADIIMNEPGVVALGRAINDGSFVPGSNYTNAQMKAIIRAVL